MSTDLPLELDPLALDLMRSAFDVDVDGDEPLRSLMEEVFQRPDQGSSIVNASIHHAPNLTIAQRLDAAAWLSASQRTFNTSVGEVSHLVFVVPVLLMADRDLPHRYDDPQKLTSFTAFESTLKEHGLVRPEAVLWTLPVLFRPDDLVGFTPSALRALNTTAFKRVKASWHVEKPPFDLNDPAWSTPLNVLNTAPLTDETPPSPCLTLRFLVAGVLDRRPDAEALWAQPDEEGGDDVDQWNERVSWWADDAITCLEKACGMSIRQVLFPSPMNAARDGGLYVWHEVLFHGTVLNAKDRAGEAGVYATLHEVHAVNEALGAASRWQDISAVAIELRSREDDTLLDTFAWPHSGLGDDQEWLDAIVDTLNSKDLLR